MSAWGRSTRELELTKRQSENLNARSKPSQPATTPFAAWRMLTSVWASPQRRKKLIAGRLNCDPIIGPAIAGWGCSIIQARYQEAAEMFAQVVALVPDSFRGYSNLGAAYVEQGRYAEAIKVLERSIAIRPMDYGYTNLGNAYFFLRQYEQAARAYEQAVKLTEKDPLLWRNLGDGYYWTQGKRAQAAGAYRQGIALAKEELRVNPQDLYAFGVLAICHAMLGEKKPALESLRRGSLLSPGDPFLRFQAALVHNQFGESDQAIQWLKKALAAGYSPSRIRDTPNFDALRADPRFQELLRAK